jgi:multicomponent Na+:H+ antiporter subunit B
MAVTVVAVALQRNLFGAVVLFGIYSFLMATVLVALDAVDVAMTEAAVGAGVSTVLLLGALYLTGGIEAKRLHRPWLPLALSIAVGAVLAYGAQGLPAFSDPEAPIHTHVAPRYPRRDRGGVHRRGRGHRAAAAQEEAEMSTDLVLRVVAKLLMPFMLLFALYVQFHGDFGPGGGFQAGVIAAAAIIFYAIIFGLAAGRRLVPDWLVEKVLAAGVLLYAGVGLAGLFLGGNFLDYFVLDRDPVHGQHRGIFWVEAGVALTVSGVMLKLFTMFAGRGRDAGETPGDE